jgi:hypothetical protein
VAAHRHAGRRFVTSRAALSAFSLVVLAAGATGMALGQDDPAVAGQTTALAAHVDDRASRSDARAQFGQSAPLAAVLEAQKAAAAKAAAAKAAAAKKAAAEKAAKAAAAKKKAAAARAAAAKKAAAARAAKAAAAKRAAAAAAAKKKAASALPAGCSQYSGNQRIACSLLPSFGFSVSEMSALVPMWNNESNWNENAENAGSGAYGIPQALPGSKMASAGSDWQTSARTQIKWGLGYIKSTYGTPSQAWSFWQANNWY